MKPLSLIWSWWSWKLLLRVIWIFVGIHPVTTKINKTCPEWYYRFVLLQPAGYAVELDQLSYLWFNQVPPQIGGLFTAVHNFLAREIITFLEDLALISYDRWDYCTINTSTSTFSFLQTGFYVEIHHHCSSIFFSMLNSIKPVECFITLPFNGYLTCPQRRTP